MILTILEHTPLWVWAVFAALILLGWQQTRTRDVSIARATILPVIMILLSLSGVVGAFGRIPSAWAACVAWAIGMALSLALAGNAVAVRGAARSAQPGYLHVPGSFVPVILILALFVTKYSAGIALAMNPSLALNTGVAISLSLVYGAFSGLFWARARSLRVVLGQYA